MEITFQEMLSEDSDEFKNFCRMSPNDFDFLLSKVEPLITKQKTRLRISIPAKVRLALTLRFLTTGDSYRSLHYLFKISSAAITIILYGYQRSLKGSHKESVLLGRASRARRARSASRRAAPPPPHLYVPARSMYLVASESSAVESDAPWEEHASSGNNSYLFIYFSQISFISQTVLQTSNEYFVDQQLCMTSLLRIHPSQLTNYIGANGFKLFFKNTINIVVFFSCFQSLLLISFINSLSFLTSFIFIIRLLYITCTQCHCIIFCLFVTINLMNMFA